ncbi:hypothetical protein PhCBS80983_g01725 [Powellomyces hirtus]|uniref:Cytochrome b5 heme-binding domain-containing protein n=1 Tax=Powellomyces hirtus TaxID=109895 RepID=A0A507EA10_9FUNG|nr:hypothetical protein PhCBS80983_g01725 [Powellomyces hirtus]
MILSPLLGVLLSLIALATPIAADLDVPIGIPTPRAFAFSKVFYGQKVSGTSPASSGYDAAAAQSGTMTPSQLQYSLFWSIDGQGTANETLHGLMELRGLNMKWAWAGLGFGKSMLDAQFIVCHQMSGNKYDNPMKIEMHEHASLFKYAPPRHLAGNQAMIPVQGAYTNNTLSCEFNRKLRPQDGEHKDLDLGFTDVLWAFNPLSGLNPSGTWFTYHEEQHRGAINADLHGGVMWPAPTKSFRKKQMHGFGMMAIWLGLFPFGAFYARYLRSTAGWTLVHMTTQMTGVAGILVFVIIIATDWVQLSRPHAIFGLILLSFIAVQFVLGFASLLGLSNESLNNIRRWVRGTHNRLGFVLLLCSIAQVGLGLDTIYPWVEPRGRAAWAIYIGVVAFWIMLFAATELYFRKTVIRKEVKPVKYSPVNEKSDNVAMRRIGRGGTAVTLVDASATAIPMPNTRLRPDLQMYTWDSLNQAILNGGQFVVGNGRYVYSIAEWMSSHPGGQLILHAVNGTDITNDYFHEAGFDAEEFVPKPKAPAQQSGRNQGTLPRVSTSTSATSDPHVSTAFGGSVLQEMKIAPLMDERDWKLVVKSRRTHVHTRLAIQKLSNLLVGELIPESNNSHAASPDSSLREFDPNEYRRYALVENTPLTPLAPIVKFRFCLLYPYDLRANEPEVIYPGQSIEICARINGKQVTRYYCPSANTGGLSMLEILVKVYPHGVMSQYLFKQKPGQRQVKIRGPFGKPLVSPERPLSLGGTDFIPKRIMFIAGGTGITPFLQLLLMTLLPVAEPLRVQVDYNAQMDDELTLRRNDKVAIKHHYYDGWGIGVNLRTGEEGAFPVTVTAPRCGPRARITLIHAINTAGESIMGSEWIEGALLAYPNVLEVHRFVADGSQPEVPLGITYPTGLTEANLDQIVRNRFGADDEDDDEDENGSSSDSRKCFVCGPPGFDSWTVDALTEVGLDMRQVVILPSDRVL